MAIKIFIEQSINDERFGKGFVEIFKLVHEIERVPQGEEIILDFSKNKWIPPFFALPLMLYIKQSQRNISCCGCSSYLKLICFQDGLLTDDFEIASQILKSYESKTYIPIVKFPALPANDEIRTKIISTLTTIINSQLNLSTQLKCAVNYLIDEAIANIKDHSSSEFGYIFAQFYPTNQYIDICIADTGNGVLKCYKDNGKLDVKNNADALKRAVTGESTKNLPQAENRGYGIRTSKKMIADGLGGVYFILSGDAFYIKDKYRDEIIDTVEQFMWNGTIVALRIPYSKTDNFDYTNYLE